MHRYDKKGCEMFACGPLLDYCGTHQILFLDVAGSLAAAARDGILQPNVTAEQVLSEMVRGALDGFLKCNPDDVVKGILFMKGRCE